jgi:hypothetical protein
VRVERCLIADEVDLEGEGRWEEEERERDERTSFEVDDIVWIL